MLKMIKMIRKCLLELKKFQSKEIHNKNIHMVRINSKERVLEGKSIYPSIKEIKIKKINNRYEIL